MAVVHVSRLAESDLLEIGSYTFSGWGATQTLRYIAELEGCCQELADQPALGRQCNYIRPGLRRMERGSHVIFYRLHQGGILVSRILHRRMLPNHHHMEE